MGSHDTPGCRSATAERESRWVERLRSAATTQSLSWRLGERVVADHDVRYRSNSNVLTGGPD